MRASATRDLLARINPRWNAISSKASAFLETPGHPERATSSGHREWSEELRGRFLGIGMVAVAVACLLFGVARFALQQHTGLLTPWLFNAVGFVVICMLYVWYRRAPTTRSEVAVHATAAIATILLLVPVAFNMPSTIWWLSLVGFAMTLMSRRREAGLWAVSTIVLVAAVPQLEPMLRVSGAAGEQALEASMARTLFAIILFGIAYAFRREIEHRTSDLTTLTADLQSANAAKDRFLANMSHELRTPLHGMLGMTEHALNEPLDAAQRHRLQSIMASGTTLLCLLNDVLDIGRANANALSLDSQPFALHDVIAQVLPPFAAQAAQRGLRFTASAEPELRRTRVGDAARIRQIVLNLVSNALKFTRDGSIAIRLDRLPEHEDGIVLRISDTGVGMAPEIAERIGEAFVRHDSGPSREHGGAGLGLAIVYELAQRMQGRVDIVAAAPQGTTVTVELRLPFSANDYSCGPQELLPRQNATGATPGFPQRPFATLRILVCEDDTLGQELMAASLNVLGHSYVIACDGVEGLQLAAQQNFDLVLSDIEMPNMDGYAFLQQFRQHEQNRGHRPIPVMAVTAHAALKDRDRFLGLGFNDYLAKPFTLAELQSMLARVSVASTYPA